MSRSQPKKLISVRVDPGIYAEIREILDKKNLGRYKWNYSTFSDIVDEAMREYIKANA